MTAGCGTPELASSACSEHALPALRVQVGRACGLAPSASSAALELQQWNWPLTSKNSGKGRKGPAGCGGIRPPYVRLSPLQREEPLIAGAYVRSRPVAWTDGMDKQPKGEVQASGLERSRWTCGNGLFNPQVQGSNPWGRTERSPGRPGSSSGSPGSRPGVTGSRDQAS
jgi:hypothetical protein